MISKGSADWPSVKAWLESEIERLRLALESPNCGIKEADLIRGEIRFARHIIATVEPLPLATVATPSYNP